MTITPKKRNERLAQAVRVLEELTPEKKLNMWTWYGCYMVACAGGWIAQDPWFKQRGLRLSQTGTPFYEGRGGYHALVGFFGIEYDQICHLFSPYRYAHSQLRGRRSVIARFKRFIRKHPA